MELFILNADISLALSTSEPGPGARGEAFAPSQAQRRAEIPARDRDHPRGPGHPQSERAAILTVEHQGNDRELNESQSAVAFRFDFIASKSETRVQPAARSFQPRSMRQPCATPMAGLSAQSAFFSTCASWTRREPTQKA